MSNPKTIDSTNLVSALRHDPKAVVRQMGLDSAAEARAARERGAFYAVLALLFAILVLATRGAG